MPELRAETAVYCGAREAMTARLVPLCALALALPADYFAAAFFEPNCTIRLIHYPPHPSPEDNEFGFAPHTDNNFITFLAQSKLRASKYAPPRATGSGRRRCRARSSSIPARRWGAT